MQLYAIPPSLFAYTFQFPFLFQHFISIWQLSSRHCVNNSFPSDVWSDEHSLQLSPGAARKNTVDTFLILPIYSAFGLCYPMFDDHLSLCLAPWQMDKWRRALIILCLISWLIGSHCMTQCRISTGFWFLNGFIIAFGALP